jgi:hypothetical protein
MSFFKTQTVLYVTFDFYLLIMTEKTFRSAFIALFGRPNSGKFAVVRMEIKR